MDFPNAVAKTIAEQITIDEQAHVALLRDALGGLAVAKPAINLSALDSAMWNAEDFASVIPAIRFTYLSKDGEEGYPGNLFVSVTFSLDEQNELRITYHATTDKPTIVNLTNHSYFNLGGAASGTILNELVTLHADTFTPVDATLIPTGEIQDVTGTSYDFTQPTAVGAHLKELGHKPPGL